MYCCPDVDPVYTLRSLFLWSEPNPEGFSHRNFGSGLMEVRTLGTGTTATTVGRTEEERRKWSCIEPKGFPVTVRKTKDILDRDPDKWFKTRRL